MAESTAVERLSAQRGGPSTMSRVFGLGSVFGKTLYDSRLAVVAIALLFAAITVGSATQVAIEFATIESRRALAAQMALLPPLFHGLLGAPINIETLPGFISWRLMGFQPLIFGIWSIIALSGTLAGEAQRGSLEMVLATPVSRVSLALQKLAGHVVALAAALGIAGLLTWAGSLPFAVLPGDEMALGAVLAELAYVLVVSLLAGALAFALAPLLGPGLAAASAGAALFGAFMVNGYRDLVPGFDVLALASPFHWTLNHRPMAGIADWPPLLLVGLLAAALAAVGVVLFQRRDLGATVSLPWARRGGGAPMRWAAWSLRGVGRRTFAERLPSAIGWGAGLGLYGLFIALSAEEFSRLLAELPEIAAIVERFYPGVDFATAGGVLQLTMFAFASLIVGLAAASLVGEWASDETERRLELVLAAPMRRVGWALRSGIGVLAALFVLALLIAAGTALGVALMGDPVGGPIVGALVLGLYGAALAGVGLLVAGLGWPRFAALAVGAFAVGTWLLDFLGAALRLPPEVLNLALVRHLGQPMAGIYNEGGMLLCAVLAVGGLVGGAIAFSRRDLI